MNAEKIADGIVTAIALLLIMASVSLAASTARLNRIVDNVPTFAPDTWRSDEPPTGEAIVGIWYEGGVRARAVVMVYGAAYPYEPGTEALAAIEYNRPDKWRYLP